MVGKVNFKVVSGDPRGGRQFDPTLEGESYYCPFCDWQIPAENDHPTQVCIDRVRDQRTRGWDRARKMKQERDEARAEVGRLRRLLQDCACGIG